MISLVPISAPFFQLPIEMLFSFYLVCAVCGAKHRFSSFVTFFWSMFFLSLLIIFSFSRSLFHARPTAEGGFEATQIQQ